MIKAVAISFSVFNYFRLTFGSANIESRVNRVKFYDSFGVKVIWKSRWKVSVNIKGIGQPLQPLV